MKIVLLGAPGAGKGTQAVKICEKFALPHISTGDIFRENIGKGTSLGKLAKSYIDKGELVPDEVTVEIVKDRLAKPDASRGFILDGFPRNLFQAEALAEFSEIDVVLDIDIDLKKLIKRLSGRRVCRACGGTYHVDLLKGQTVCPVCQGELYTRDDDKEEAVAKRLEVYRQKTEPLIDYYKKKGILKTVDGDGDIEKVFDRVKEVLGE